MRGRTARVCTAAAIAAMAGATWAREARADTTLTLDGAVAEGGATHEFVEFEVPAGTAEIEVRHAAASSDDVLDWGLLDPSGFRGWGGGNKEPAIVGEQAASRSYVAGPIAAGTWRVVIGKAKIKASPAAYALEVVLRTAPTLAPQPERAPYAPGAALEQGERWYAGDFHVHSRESGDADPTLDEVGEFARSRKLDFVELSEHNTLTQLEFFADAQTRFPDVLFMPGMEFTTYAGHANAIGATEWVDHKVGVGDASIEGAFEQLRAQGALVAINHPVLDLGDLCIGCAWKHETSAALVDAVEIETGAYKVSGVIFLTAALEFWEKLLDEGRHVAAIGGSDDHDGGVIDKPTDSPMGSPTTLVRAAELSPKGIIDAVKASRTVVKLHGPDDPMIELGSTVAPDGDTIAAKSTTLEAKITGAKALGADIYEARWVKNGVPMDSVTFDGADFTLSLPVTPPETGEDRYRVEVFADFVPRTLTSYVWVVKGTAEDPSAQGAGGSGGSGGSAPADDEGCGCRVAGAPGNVGVPASSLLALALAVSRRSRRQDRKNARGPLAR